MMSCLTGDTKGYLDMNLLELYYQYLIEKDNCGHECTYDPVYGFVPEAGCPVHDKEEENECKDML